MRAWSTVVSRSTWSIHFGLSVASPDGRAGRRSPRSGRSAARAATSRSRPGREGIAVDDQPGVDVAAAVQALEGDAAEKGGDESPDWPEPDRAPQQRARALLLGEEGLDSVA